MNDHQDVSYLRVLRDVRKHGLFRADRTGVGSFSVFGRLARYDLTNGQVPILNSKKVLTDKFVHEMLWFRDGDTSIKYLLDNNVNIWNSWVLPESIVMREMTTEEIDNELRKRFDMPVLSVRLVGKLPTVDGKTVTWRLGADDEGNPVIISTKKYFPAAATTFLHNQKYLQALYRTINGKIAETMSGGDVGAGVYGAQWRHWEDMRTVTPDQFEKRYKAKGYEKVATLPRRKSKPDRVVIYREIDQLQLAIDTLKKNPDSRRILVVAYNPGRADDVGLPPCHAFFQFSSRLMTLKELLGQDNQNLEGFGAWLRSHVLVNPSDDAEIVNPESEIPQSFKKGATEALIKLREEAGLEVRMLSCLLYMRSNDLCLGKPFNIGQYGVLVHMVAQCTNMKADELIWVGGDAHIYANQLDGTDIQLQREPFEDVRPVVKLNPEIKNIDDFKFEDITFEGYTRHHPFISFPVAV